MSRVVFVCCRLVVAATVLHCEVSRSPNAGLPSQRIPNRSDLVVVALAASAAHAAEMAT
jgi:hypothetical protein